MEKNVSVTVATDLANVTTADVISVKNASVTNAIIADAINALVTSVAVANKNFNKKRAGL